MISERNPKMDRDEEKARLRELKLEVEGRIIRHSGEEGLAKVNELFEALEEAESPEERQVKTDNIMMAFGGDSQHFVNVMQLMLATNDAFDGYKEKLLAATGPQHTVTDMVFTMFLQLILQCQAVGMRSEDILGMVSRATITTEQFFDDYTASGLGEV
jgi:hypothetical protein